MHGGAMAFLFVAGAAVGLLALALAITVGALRWNSWQWRRLEAEGVSVHGVVTRVDVSDERHIVAYEFRDPSGGRQEGTSAWPIGSPLPRVAEPIELLILPNAPWNSVPQLVHRLTPRV
jgi:hypothetical protein